MFVNSYGQTAAPIPLPVAVPLPRTPFVPSVAQTSFPLAAAPPVPLPVPIAVVTPSHQLAAPSYGAPYVPVAPPMVPAPGPIPVPAPIPAPAVVAPPYQPSYSSPMPTLTASLPTPTVAPPLAVPYPANASVVTMFSPRPSIPFAPSVSSSSATSVAPVPVTLTQSSSQSAVMAQSHLFISHSSPPASSLPQPKAAVPVVSTSGPPSNPPELQSILMQSQSGHQPTAERLSGFRSVTFALPGEAPSQGAALPSVAVPKVPPVLASVPVAPPEPLPSLFASEEVLPTPAAPSEAALGEKGETFSSHVPDYPSWLYPVQLEGSSAWTPTLRFPLGDAMAPYALAAPSLLPMCEADVLAALPMTLPPEFVVFGGAKYSGAPPELPRPLFSLIDRTKRSWASREAAESQRLQFLAEQLEVAKHYLKIETARISGDVHRLATSSSTSMAEARLLSVPEGSAAQLPDELHKEEEEDLAKANIWTVAYFGSPTQLRSVMEKPQFSSALDGAGYVRHRRRQWGLKKAGNSFELGLGMKGTPLQFAAAAGKLDNVVLLLSKGARDSAAPLLKEMLSKESMEVIGALHRPRRRVIHPDRVGSTGLAGPAPSLEPMVGRVFERQQASVLDDTRPISMNPTTIAMLGPVGSAH